MLKVLFHSSKGGTGKSNLVANLAVALSSKGMKVGVIDMDYAAPGLHVIFELTRRELKFTLDDAIEGRCPSTKAAIDLTKKFGVKKGGLIFIPASHEASSIVSIVRKSYELSAVQKVIDEIVKAYSLDYLLIDSRPGINQFALMAFDVSDVVLLVARLDRQDVSSSQAVVQVAKALAKPVLLVANMIPSEEADTATERKLTQSFNMPLIAMFPYEPDVQMNLSSGILVVKKPAHDFGKDPGTCDSLDRTTSE